MVILANENYQNRVLDS